MPRPGKMTPQAKLRALENDWLAAERAVLESPDTPECMRACSRKAVERLEGKCQKREKSTFLFPAFPRQEEVSADSCTEPRAE